MISGDEIKLCEPKVSSRLSKEKQFQGLVRFMSRSACELFIEMFAVRLDSSLVLSIPILILFVCYYLKIVSSN